jgi:hypothetical protein
MPTTRTIGDELLSDIRWFGSVSRPASSGAFVSGQQSFVIDH